MELFLMTKDGFINYARSWVILFQKINQNHTELNLYSALSYCRKSISSLSIFDTTKHFLGKKVSTSKNSAHTT